MVVPALIFTVGDPQGIVVGKVAIVAGGVVFTGTVAEVAATVQPLLTSIIVAVYTPGMPNSVPFVVDVETGDGEVIVNVDGPPVGFVMDCVESATCCTAQVMAVGVKTTL